MITKTKEVSDLEGSLEFHLGKAEEHLLKLRALVEKGRTDAKVVTREIYIIKEKEMARVMKSRQGEL